MHEQLVAKHQCFTPRTTNEVEGGGAAEKKEEMQLKKRKRGSQEHRTGG
jgi:hypothetical protein